MTDFALRWFVVPTDERDLEIEFVRLVSSSRFVRQKADGDTRSSPLSIRRWIAADGVTE